VQAPEPITGVHFCSEMRVNSLFQVGSSSPRFFGGVGGGGVAVAVLMGHLSFRHAANASQRSCNCAPNSRAVPQKIFISMAAK
jgi:hypothetical protein